VRRDSLAVAEKFRDEAEAGAAEGSERQRNGTGGAEADAAAGAGGDVSFGFDDVYARKKKERRTEDAF
jgi:hypothetical protein